MNRRLVTLLTATTFLVLTVSGILAFVLPFSISVVGLHALMGFVFVGLVVLHVVNSRGPMGKHLQSRTLWMTLGITAALTALFVWQPAPIRAVLGWSGNLGPAQDRFELSEDGMIYHYTPASSYRMKLEVRRGTEFDPDNPPNFAIWLENQSHYHIKTLHEPTEGELPYWSFKRRGWEEAMRAAEESGTDLEEQFDLDGISSATENSSFDPADYILPGDVENPMPYRLLVEINQPGDDQPSLVYVVEIDNADPRVFQLLDLVGFPKNVTEEGGEEEWALYYVDDTISSALELIDSALLIIERDEN